MPQRGWAILLVVFLGTLPAEAEDWPRWRGPRGDGTWYGPELPEAWPAGGLTVAWRRPIGGGYSGIAVVGERVLTMDRQTEPMEAERVVALRAADGQPLWEFSYGVEYGKLDYGTGPRATPTVHDGRVYTLGAVGHLHCLDLATGERLWSHDLVADFGAVLPTWGLAASPVIWQDLVIVHPGGTPDGCYMAFDRVTGEKRWRSHDDPAGYCTPIVVGQGASERLVGWTPEHVVGLSPKSGEVFWKIPYKVNYGVSIATPVFHRGIVFVTGYWEGAKAIRLGDAPGDATLLWEDERHLQGLMSQPLCRGRHVYSLDRDEGLICFELETGKKVWDDDHQMTPRGRSPQANLVWLEDTDRAIILNADGDLILARLTPKGYEEQSRTNIIGSTWAHPAFAGRHVFARNDSEIVCVPLLPEADSP